MNKTGGRISMQIDGVNYSARGEVKIMPSTVSLENGVNRDGSGYSTVKPELARAECTFDPRAGATNENGAPLIYSESLLLASVNATIVELNTGTTHLLTGASFSGKPEIDTSTGEVSGLALETDRYQVIRV